MSTTGSILLVDDEEKIRKTVGRALRAEGHLVTEAPGGRAAQKAMAAQSFDVLVIDNLMSDITGLDVIRELVAGSPESERPQIVMMTATRPSRAPSRQ